MKSINIILVLIFGLLLANAVNAESPREQLKQMVEQLQQTPNDNALREKIIKLAPTLKPSPALPDAAITFEGRARFAFKSAKSEDDFLAAAREYEKAVSIAPWVLNLYSDLCLSYEKSGKYVDAKRNCENYLIGLVDPAEIADVKGRIAGLEFGIEKASETALLKKKSDEKLLTTEGDWYGRDEGAAAQIQIKVIQQGDRFEAQFVAGAPHCLRNLKATATTIEWGLIPKDGNKCFGGPPSHDGANIQCQLIGQTTLDCQVKGYSNGSPWDAYDRSYRLNRR